MFSKLIEEGLGIVSSDGNPDTSMGVSGPEDNSNPVEELKKVMLTLESAMVDLSNYDNPEVAVKYNNLLSASDFGDELTTENAAVDFLIDSTVYTVEKIWLFIKNLYISGIKYLKRIYVTFLAKYTKLSYNLDMNKVNPNNLKTKFGMFIDSNGFLDRTLSEFMVGSSYIKELLNKMYDINNNILLTMPKGEVMKVVIEGNTGPLNDMLNSYRAGILNKWNDVFFSKNSIDVLNKNIVYTNITTDITNPYVFTSDGYNSKVLHMHKDGVIKIASCNVRREIAQECKYYIDTINDINANMVNHTSLKDIVTEDFKLYDRVKKDSDSFIAQVKKYNKIDNYNLFIMSTNMATMFNIVLNFSLNRIEMFNKAEEYGVSK